MSLRLFLLVQALLDWRTPPKRSWAAASPRSGRCV